MPYSRDNTDKHSQLSHGFNVLGVDDKELNLLGFKQVDDRFPENTGTLHSHMRTAMLLDPVDIVEQENRVHTKRLNLLSFRSHDASGNGLLVNIQTASALDQDIHNTHLSTAIEIED